MSDLNLQLSQLIDNELAKDESVKLLEQVLNQPELANTLRHYQWLGSVIKSEEIVHTEVDFVSQVSQNIKQEAVVFAPAWRRRKSSVQTLSAIAASIAIIAIIGFGGIQLATETPPEPITIAGNTTNTKLIAPTTNKIDQQFITVATTDDQVIAKIEPRTKVDAGSNKVDPRFIAYLEAHDNSLYAAGASGFQSYVRVVSHGQR